MIKIVIIIIIILMLLLIPNKDNHRYHNSFNLAAHSSEEIFEGASSYRVLSVPPVVNQRSIRMSMRVMVRVRSIRVPQSNIIIIADDPNLYVTEKIMRILS